MMPNNQERWTTEQYRAYVNKDIQPVKTHKVVSGSSTPEVKKGKNVNRQLTQAEKSEKWAAIDWPGPSIFRMPMYEGRNKTDRMHYMQRHKVKKAYAEAAQASLRGYGLEPDKYIKGVVKITLRFFFNDRHWRDKDNWGYRTFPSRAALTEGYLELIAKLKPLVEKGLAAAVYTQTTDVEGEVNGLMTYDRAMIKMDADKLRQAHQELYNHCTED